MFHVSKAYPASGFALRDLNLEVAKGEMIFLTGPSGAGKTTLMKLLFADERPEQGQLLVLGRNMNRLRRREVAALRREIGVVFQDFKLLVNRTVEENVALPLYVVGWSRRAARTEVFAMLKRVGLQHLRHQYPPTLSGGEQQRVALARALVNHPTLLLADEPTGNLDAALALEITALVASAARHGTTVLIATHDHNLLAAYRRRTLRLVAGRLVEDRAAGQPPP